MAETKNDNGSPNAQPKVSPEDWMNAWVYFCTNYPDRFYEDIQFTFDSDQAERKFMCCGYEPSTFARSLDATNRRRLFSYVVKHYKEYI